MSAPELLLCSLASFRGVLTPLLRVLAPRTICEIGIGKGQLTAYLLEQGTALGAAYTGVDPSVSEAFCAAHTGPAARILRQDSLTALATLAPQDVVIVDGDHNYYTVLHEIRAICRHAGHYPVMVFHDIAWPWARRDQYCSPEAIPAEFRHPFSRDKGPAPRQAALEEWGIAGATSPYGYSAAEAEGGPRNGVLTAIEDARRDPALATWQWIEIPAIFGMGILVEPTHLAEEARAFVARLADAAALMAPLLETLEVNRNDLYVELIRGQRAYESLRKHAADLQGAYDALAGAYRNSERLFRELDGQFKTLNGQFGELLAAYRAKEAEAARGRAKTDA